MAVLVLDVGRLGTRRREQEGSSECGAERRGRILEDREAVERR
jgi:hypothetical protein